MNLRDFSIYFNYLSNKDDAKKKNDNNEIFDLFKINKLVILFVIKKEEFLTDDKTFGKQIINGNIRQYVDS